MVSCEKEISVELPRPESKIMVEGFIEIDDYSVVFLTKNLSYFDAIDTSFVDDLIISGDDAVVIVYDGAQNDTLIHVTLDRWPYKAYRGTKIKGQSGKEYELKIIYDDKVYYSHTTIKDPIQIDSVLYEKIFLSDTLGTFTAYWKNPPGYGDYFTLTLKMSTQKWFYRSNSMVSLIDDKLLESNEVISIPMITKGYERNSFFPKDSDEIDWNDIMLFKKGDTVSLKLSVIDEEAYLFWSSWYRSKMTDGNPFTNPARIKSNISGNPANGSWIGYGSYIQTLYINEEGKTVFIN